jgi:hypothetical protein
MKCIVLKDVDMGCHHVLLCDDSRIHKTVWLSLMNVVYCGIHVNVEEAGFANLSGTTLIPHSGSFSLKVATSENTKAVLNEKMKIAETGILGWIYSRIAGGLIVCDEDLVDRFVECQYKNELMAYGKFNYLLQKSLMDNRNILSQTTSREMYRGSHLNSGHPTEETLAKKLSLLFV